MLTNASINQWFGGKLLKPQDRLESLGKYFPYGEDRYNPSPANPANDNEKFGTYTRDSASGLDYANRPYYSPGLSRFMTDDPSGNNWKPTDPGSWNAYAYVQGDPTNSKYPNDLSVIILPPVVPGFNCSTAFIEFADELGESIQQLFDSDQGTLGIMSYFEQQGSGSAADQSVWAAVDWTFLNRWDLSAKDKAWFYGPQNIPTSFKSSVTTGSSRSQVFDTAGQLLPDFSSTLLNILEGDIGSKQCHGLGVAFDTALGTILAHNQTPVPGWDFIPNPVPGALQFGSNGAVPGHGRFVIQKRLLSIQDGVNLWTFFSDVYRPPTPPKTPRGPGGIPGHPPLVSK